MRLLLTTDAVGGVWQYSLELAEALSLLGAETVLAVLGPVSAQRLAEARATSGVTAVDTGLPLDWLCDGPERVQTAGRALADLARREQVDLVHLNMPTLAAGSSWTVPVVAVAHGCVATWWEAARDEPLATEYHWHRALMAKGLAAADRVVAPSDAYAATVARHYALREPPVVVYNGRSLPLMSTSPPGDAALVVGRLWDEVKGVALLDEVAALLSVPFDAVGAVRGPHREIAVLRHLEVLGEIGADQLAAKLAERPVFVSAARFEPFGLAVLEAAAAGCALVLSDIATFRELWDGAACFVPTTDAVAYMRAIEALIADPAERARLGHAARRRAGTYTPEATAAAMAAVYAALLPYDRRKAAA